MDTLTHYRDIIERLLTDVVRMLRSSPSIQHKTIFDRQANSYAVIAEGWDKARRVHHFIAHLEIINGKVWVQEDNTDLVIAEALEHAGIPKSDMVLGFHPPEVRRHTEYAVA